MTTETQNKKGMGVRVPTLRFPEFSGPWEEERLGEAGDIITGTTPPTANSEYYGGEFPWITPTDINDEKDIYTSAKLLTRDGMKKGRFVPKNSLLVTCIASIGKNAILRVDGSCNQQINAIVPNENNNVDFLYYLLEKSKNTLIRFAGAGGMQMLNKKDFSDLKFKIALFPEQQKIAEFLGVMDEKIEGLAKKKKSLEAYKKGVMQKIFAPSPSLRARLGGSGNPELRFHDENGNSYPDWEEKRLGELFVERSERNGKKSFELLSISRVEGITK